MTKQCSRCKILKEPSEFHKDKSKKFGLGSYCKVCATLNSSEYYTKNSGRIRQRVTSYSHSHIRKSERCMISKLKSLVTAAKARKWEVELTGELLVDQFEKQNGLCTYSGLPLVSEPNQPNTVSLDRIDSKIGYVKGNIHLVCAMVNRMKQEFAEDAFLSMCRTITENTKKKDTQESGPRFDDGNTTGMTPLS